MNLAQKTVFKSEELNFIVKNGYKDKSNEGAANFPDDPDENNADNYFDINQDEINDPNQNEEENDKNRL